MSVWGCACVCMWQGQPVVANCQIGSVDGCSVCLLGTLDRLSGAERGHVLNTAYRSLLIFLLSFSPLLPSLFPLALFFSPYLLLIFLFYLPCFSYPWLFLVLLLWSLVRQPLAQCFDSFLNSSVLQHGAVNSCRTVNVLWTRRTSLVTSL